MKRKTTGNGNGTRGAATLSDVAARVGVTPMTVSRALNGGSVSASVRESVLRAVEEFGYRPNLVARGMRSGKSRQIGVLVRNNSRLNAEESRAHPLAYDLVLGVSEGLEEAGYMMSFVRLSDIDPEKHTQSSAFQGHLLDGLIVANDVPAARAAHLEELVSHCLWLDSSVWRPELCVRRDETMAGMETAKRVAQAGYREWVLLSTPDAHAPHAHFSLQARDQAVREVAAQVGARCREFVVDYYAPNFAALWPQLSPEIAIIANSIYPAYALLYAANEAGKIIGRDFALASCDEGFEAGLIEWSNLAHVSFDRFALGLEAARLLLARLNDPLAPVASRQLRGNWVEGNTLPKRLRVEHPEES